jgi:hypothetical protein
MESLLPLALFAFVASITPGPNNIMLTSSGLVFGFARTIPHMLGVTVGFGVVLALCAAGIGSVIVAVPAIHLGLKILGSGYLLYLAWQLRKMAFKQDGDASAKPMSFIGAAAFQFANPKAWVMAITGAAGRIRDCAVRPGVFCDQLALHWRLGRNRGGVAALLGAAEMAAQVLRGNGAADGLFRSCDLAVAA